MKTCLFQIFEETFKYIPRTSGEIFHTKSLKQFSNRNPEGIPYKILNDENLSRNCPHDIAGEIPNEISGWIFQ